VLEQRLKASRARCSGDPLVPAAKDASCQRRMSTARDPLRRIQKWPRLTIALLAGASGLTKPRQNKPNQALHVTRSSVSAGHKHAPVEGPRQHIERQFHVDARIDLSLSACPVRTAQPSLRDPPRAASGSAFGDQFGGIGPAVCGAGSIRRHAGLHRRCGLRPGIPDRPNFDAYWSS
jgi:hypothetical protein